MSEWKEVTIGDITILKNGKKRPSVLGTIPVYGGNGIMDYVDSHNDENCIAIGRVGAYCGCVYLAKGKVWISDNAISAKANQNADNVFIYYLLGSLNLNRHRIGGAQPLMTQDLISRIKISLPPIEVQCQIASILSSIDDKIAVNRRICENLEAQAQALFKHWFIDFAPFKDGNFVESELGMIPEGWRVGTLGDVVSQITDKVGKQSNVKVLSPINTGQLVLSDEYFTKQVYSKSIEKYIMVKPKDFAYNPARVNIGSIGMNEFNFDGCVSPVYVVFRSKVGYHYYIDMFRQGCFFKSNVQKLAIGGVRQTLRYDDLARIPVIIPPISIIEKYNVFHEQKVEIIKHYSKENFRLTTLRDTLLPKLMSGQIKL